MFKFFHLLVKKQIEIAFRTAFTGFFRQLRSIYFSIMRNPILSGDWDRAVTASCFSNVWDRPFDEYFTDLL